MGKYKGQGGIGTMFQNIKNTLGSAAQGVGRYVDLQLNPMKNFSSPSKISPVNTSNTQVNKVPATNISQNQGSQSSISQRNSQYGSNMSAAYNKAKSNGTLGKGFGK